MKNIKLILNDIENLDLQQQINLEKYTTIRLKKIGDILIVNTIEALQKTIKILFKNKIKYHIVGWGANQVLHNTSDTLFIKLDFELDRNVFDKPQGKYTLTASTPLNILTSHAQKFGLQGWEVFTGIPASFGGAIYMNAGTALGEIGNLIESVKILDKKGILKTIMIKKESFSYRSNHFVADGDIIVEATIRHLGLNDGVKDKIKSYLELRKESQPLTTKNCGCVFKNFDSNHKAGQFIDLIGLKGLSVGDLGVSLKHANFIENKGSGSSEDFLSLIKLIKYELELFAGIEFELEAKIY